MAVSPIKSVRIVANTNSKTFPTVNIVAAAQPNAKQHAQVIGPTGAKFATHQDSGGGKKGLKTIYIPGYVGPG